jgi:hypothetical protein
LSQKYKSIDDKISRSAPASAEVRKLTAAYRLFRAPLKPEDISMNTQFMTTAVVGTIASIMALQGPAQASSDSIGITWKTRAPMLTARGTL